MADYIRNPRKWQTEALDRWANLESARLCIQAPVGSGKTWVLCAIAAQWLQASILNRVIIAATDHTGVSQIEETLKPLIRTPIYKGDSLTVENFNNYRLLIVTHPKLIRLISRVQGHHVLLIFDECHHDNVNAIVYHHATSKFQRVVGCSASPWSEGCLRFYQEHYIYKLSDAIRDEVVCSYRFVLEKNWEGEDHYSIEFTESVDDADITYETKDNEKVIEQWKEGNTSKLRTFNIGSVGLDNPAVSLVIIRRKTQSDILAYQMLGRGLRFLGGKHLLCVVKHDTTLKTLQRAIKRAG